MTNTKLATKAILLILLFSMTSFAYKPCRHNYKPDSFKTVIYKGDKFKHHFSISIPSDMTEAINIPHCTYYNTFPCLEHKHETGLHIQISSATFYNPKEGSTGIHAAAQRALHSQILDIDTLFHKEKLPNGDYLFIDKYCSDEHYNYKLLKQKGNEYIVVTASSGDKSDTLLLNIFKSVEFIDTPKLKIPLQTYIHNNLYSILLPDSTKTELDTSWGSKKIVHKYQIPNRISDEITVTINNYCFNFNEVTEEYLFGKEGVWDSTSEDSDLDSIILATPTHYVLSEKVYYGSYNVVAITQSPSGLWNRAEIRTTKEFRTLADSLAKSFKGLREKAPISKVIKLPLKQGLAFSDLHPKPTNETKYTTDKLIKREHIEDDSLSFTMLIPQTLKDSIDMTTFALVRDDLTKFEVDFTSAWGYPFSEYGSMEEEDKVRLEKEFKNEVGDHFIYYKPVNGYTQIDIYPFVNGKNNEVKIEITAPAHLQEVVRTMAQSVKSKILK